MFLASNSKVYNLQGVKDDEVAKLLSDLYKHKGPNQERTRMISMWSKNQTILVTVIDFLKSMKEELNKRSTRFVGNMFIKITRLEISPQRKPLAKNDNFVLYRSQKNERR